MGNLLARQPGSLAFQGAGRRAATLRNRVRFFAKLLLMARGNARSLLHSFVGTLCGGSSGHALPEPGNRGTLRNVNRTFTFLHEVTGTEQVKRLTATPLYDAVYRQNLSICEPGRTVQQAPRFPVGLLALVENFVTTDSNPATCGCMADGFFSRAGARCVSQTIVACQQQTSLSQTGV